MFEFESVAGKRNQTVTCVQLNMIYGMVLCNLHVIHHNMVMHIIISVNDSFIKQYEKMRKNGIPIISCL